MFDLDSAGNVVSLSIILLGVTMALVGVIMVGSGARSESGGSACLGGVMIVVGAVLVGMVIFIDAVPAWDF